MRNNITVTDMLEATTVTGQRFIINITKSLGRKGDVWIVYFVEDAESWDCESWSETFGTRGDALRYVDAWRVSNGAEVSAPGEVYVVRGVGLLTSDIQRYGDVPEVDDVTVESAQDLARFFLYDQAVEDVTRRMRRQDHGSAVHADHVAYIIVCRDYGMPDWPR